MTDKTIYEQYNDYYKSMIPSPEVRISYLEEEILRLGKKLEKAMKMIIDLQKESIND